nr:retrovirus-related Pol polyprotein from transposon TNT 1-94 [Tanacetum cinerariifolium]
CCLTSWFSKKQITLAISTTKAAYVSAGKARQQALWMKQALIEYDVRLDDIPIMRDNKGTIDLSKNPMQHSRTKHIKICHHFLRDNVQKGHISIEKVPSVDNITDILMKPLKLQAVDASRVVTKISGIESENNSSENALSKSVIETHMQMQEVKVNMGKALDVGLDVTESSGTESDKQDTSSISGNGITYAVDVDIRPVYDQVPFAEVQLTAQHNVLANEQQHSVQSEPIYDTHLLEKVDRITPHYLPKVREFVLAKPHHVIAPGSFRNSSKELQGSNNMAHNYYLEKAKKKTQDKKRNLKPREMSSARTHHTPNTCTPKPRSNNQTSMNWSASKSSEETLKVVQKAYHSRNPSSFLDSKHFVCSTCQKYVFNANHDACITKFLKELNSRVKVQSPKTRNSDKLVEPKIHTQKPGRQIVTGHRWVPTGKTFTASITKFLKEVNSRVKVQSPKTGNSNKLVEPKIHTQKRGRQIVTGHRFSPNKSFVVHEKTNTPRSCLRRIPTGRIVNTVGLRCVPNGKTFIASITKVDCEPPNGSNKDITNPYECDQTLNVSAGLVPKIVSQQPCIPPNRDDWDHLFQPMFDEYFTPPIIAVSPVSVAAAPRAVDLADSPVLMSIDQDAQYSINTRTTFSNHFSRF